jgi:hypothetical protein
MHVQRFEVYRRLRFHDTCRSSSGLFQVSNYYLTLAAEISDPLPSQYYLNNANLESSIVMKFDTQLVGTRSIRTPCCRDT